ncbi:LysR family transcriptional regulator [Gordonia liuliyuniae]|uniref:LysR family transcriptional regulator n=1 Tax=Gordonia liuliyuniae TaxID=2911517 RepID=A0ABS9IS30_9ACTN|nr:LysR family transcriptional regulator [Gordonia liuliyuniae]MCF8588327.1 LysR family transcriptional regulator [Gordonia liuliyuniae]
MSELTTSALREILADLPYLIAVAETGGVTAAADELGVPQPTVSRGLTRLGERLGAPMLVRDGRGVALTPEATEFLPYAHRAVDATRAGIESTGRRADERADTVSLAFQNDMGRVVVPALLRAVLELRPGARFDLRQGSRTLCTDALEAGDVDAAIVSPPYAGELGVQTARLFAEPLVLTVPAGHRWAGRSRVRLRELTGEHMVQLRPEFGLRGHVDALLARAGAEPERGFEGEDLHTLRGLIAVGLGVAILPPAAPAPAGIVELSIADTAAHREIGISWPRDVAFSPAAQTMIDVAARTSTWLPHG